MKKVLLSLCGGVAFCLCMASFAQAESALLGDLKANGAEVQRLDDSEMAKERGTNWTLLTNQARPSQVGGYKEHHVTYYGWGNLYDTRYYRYHGSGYNPGEIKFIEYSGGVYAAVGDTWLADLKSDVGSWNRNNAVPVEAHFQVVRIDSNKNILEVSPFGLHQTSGWNRPLNKYSW